MVKAACGFGDGVDRTGRGLLVQFGPTLIVDIGFDADHLPESGSMPDLAANLAAKGVHALVDTGANASCIDAGLAMQLNLPIIDRRRVGGVGGVHDVNMYLGHVLIPSLGRYISGAFAGVDLVAGGQPHVALIGRTFLQDFVMYYDGRSGLVYISDDSPQI
jgi:hypothetical protein